MLNIFWVVGGGGGLQDFIVSPSSLGTYQGLNWVGLGWDWRFED